MKTGLRILAAILLCITLQSPVLAKGRLKGSPHDLSVQGSGRVCSFCHTPHGTSTTTPLWNHKLSDSVYKIYQSSSLDAKVGQPTGSSKMCLSCHDGTVALTHTIGQGSEGGVYITPGDSNLGTDLSDDHPISFKYTDALSAKDPQIRLASTIPQELRLDQGREVQCTTCHDAHDNQYGAFVVMDNERSGMCVSCHDLDGWSASSHQSSTALVADATDTYLRKSRYATVAENACLSCHRPHSAGGHERLLHFDKLERNCLSCHNGLVAQTNLQAEFSKRSTHNVMRYDGIHDLKESPLYSERHVECVDCHNPHATSKGEAVQAPAIPAAMQKISGVTQSGSIILHSQNEYEVCFKCHADNPDRIESKITRQTTQTNVRLEFDPSNPSFHPIVAEGANEDVPSLRLPLTISSIIYCTACHNSDSASKVKGPHGSTNEYLLAHNYETEDFTNETELAYELCYKCHSRNSIINDESFNKHNMHIVDEKTPCSVCHDAHGISFTQGSTTNNSHLINFDTSVVQASAANGRLEFVNDMDTFRGSCSLLCHDRDHDDESY